MNLTAVELRRYAAGAIALWGCELLVARLTWAPQSPWLALASLVLLAVVPLPLWLVVVRSGMEERRRAAWASAIAWAPLGGVVGRIVLVPGWKLGGALVLLDPLHFAVASVIAGLVWGFWRREPALRPEVAAASVLAASLAAWWLNAGWSLDDRTALLARSGSLPPAYLVGAVVAAFAGTALGAARWPAPTALAVLLLVVMVPDLEPAPAFPPRDGAVPAGRPDIVLVTIDTLRAEDAETMAVFTRLAEAGTRFDEAQAAAPWTLPSMAAVMTGQPHDVHGAGRRETGEVGAIAAEVPTLAERLHAAGYDTAAIVGPNLFLMQSFGFTRGFDHFDHAFERTSYAVPASHDDPLASPWAHELLRTWSLAGREPLGGADWVVDRAIGVLGARRERPLFLWLHLMDVHPPFRHADASDRPWDERMALENRSSHGSPVDWHSGALDELALVDAELLRLLDAIGAAGRPEPVILLTADHGESFADGARHGHDLGQDLLRVPLVAVGVPGLARGAVAETVGHVDVAPTLLAAAGAADPTLPGRDLAAGAPPGPRTSWNLLYGDPSPSIFAVRDGPLKLLQTGEAARLFDLATDPGEARDVSAERPEDASRLDVAPRGFPAGGGLSLDGRDEQLLRTLGYVE